jgi:hypothetical protein
MGQKSIQDELKSESQKVVQELASLRDEIKLKLHLATEEGKEAWNKLEPQLAQFEQRFGQAKDEAIGELRKAGSDLKANLERFYQGLRK